MESKKEKKVFDLRRSSRSEILLLAKLLSVIFSSKNIKVRVRPSKNPT